MPIRELRRSGTEAVVALWERCDLTRPWNDPHADIDAKLADSPWGLLVECDADRIVGTVMVGFAPDAATSMGLRLVGDR